MKSLSILVLLGTASAILLGAIFAITPASANNPEAQTTQIETNQSSQPIAPVTGNVAEAETAPVVAESAAASEDPGVVLSSTFTNSIEKDTASFEAAQEAEAAAVREIEAAAQQQASFESFVASVNNGKASQVTGVYVENTLAYSVVRQPGGNSAFVSETDDVVTQFALAAQYGSQAFLAHNYLAGASFSQLSVGQVITLVYGDGTSRQFRIETIKRYQALSPDSTQSSFVDLETGDQLSNSSLFHTMYNSDNSVVLQTCIAQDGLSTWGRLFVIAVPLS